MTLPWITVKICYVQQLGTNLDSCTCWDGNERCFSGPVIVSACDQNEPCVSPSCENAFSLFYLTVKNCCHCRFSMVTYSSSKFMFGNHRSLYTLHCSWQATERHNTNTRNALFTFFILLSITFFFFLFLNSSYIFSAFKRTHGWFI